MTKTFGNPTFLVAVSDGSIFMGYSPNQLTLATNGENVLEDTPLMGLQEGPPSPNDEGQAKFQRHVYFCDGERYLRLNGHTGEVSDWTAFVGDDFASGRPIKGEMPFGADIVLDIISADSNGFVVEGGQTDFFDTGDEVIVQETEENDGSYEVTGVSTSNGNTVIAVTPAPSDQGAEGAVFRVTSRARMIALYRGRIVLSGVTQDPSNIFFSAVDDPRNWDFAPETTTVTQAIALAATENGKIGDEVTALIPFSDDLLMIGGRRSVWLLQGDPMAGGQIVNISRETGIVGPDAWAFDERNRLFFVGQDGLYQTEPDGTGLRPVAAGTLDNTFRTKDYADVRCVASYDLNRNYVYIFWVRDEGENDRGLIYDVRSEAFFPIRVPDSNGPQSVWAFNSPKENDRTVILGGRDGYLRAFRKNRANDSDGTEDVPIESWMTIGPIQLNAAMQARAQDAFVRLADNSGPVDVEIYAAPTPEQALLHQDEPRFRRRQRINDRRAIRQRIGAGSFVLKLSQDKLHATWAYGGGQMTLAPAGRNRRVRR